MDTNTNSQLTKAPKKGLNDTCSTDQDLSYPFMMKEAKKRCLKASMFFYFYPACFPTFCHLNPISGWLNHVNLQRLMVFTSILQAFMLVSQPPKSECWLMSIHLNQFQSIYVCVFVFQVKMKNTTILPAFSPVSQAWGSSWATVSWRRVR